MAQAFHAQPPPLVTTPEGVIRVSGTRVSLDSVVAAFDQGASAEEIADRYPTLDVTSVYEVIAYVLRNRASVDEYLATQSQRSDQVQAEVERRFPPHGIRERLLARRAQGAAGPR
jgi:uncharacterized protein (DUF433 family)